MKIISNIKKYWIDYKKIFSIIFIGNFIIYSILILPFVLLSFMYIFDIWWFQREFYMIIFSWVLFVFSLFYYFYLLLSLLVYKNNEDEFLRKWTTYSEKKEEKWVFRINLKRLNSFFLIIWIWLFLSAWMHWFYDFLEHWDNENIWVIVFILVFLFYILKNKWVFHFNSYDLKTYRFIFFERFSKIRINFKSLFSIRGIISISFIFCLYYLWISDSKSFSFNEIYF